MNVCVIIPSARANNLVASVTALRKQDPELPSERIVVVDDGARTAAEARLPHVTWVKGEKPFIFARNINLGIGTCPGDVILLNDDATLLTPRGFSAWWELMQQHPEIGVCSCGVRGAVGNPRQRAAAHGRLEFEKDDLAFVCVYIPRRALDLVGPLDERFSGYGFEDNDYCERVRYHGLKLAVWHGCVVQHDGKIPSTFRTRADLPALLARNRRLHAEKRATIKRAELVKAPARVDTAAPPTTVGRRVDLMYLAWNRLAFTQETFAALLANTDWDQVHELLVYDDGSIDGTREWLESNIDRVPAPHRLVRTSFRSPVTAMGHFIDQSAAPILAKLDNDAMVPPRWLAESLDVLDRHPALTMLGIEAMTPHADCPASPRTFAPAQFISGLGLYRREAFARGKPAAFKRYFGLEEWQVAQGSKLACGWIQPALPVFLLDRTPFEPWSQLSAEYVRRGWQRVWPAYARDCTLWRWRWPESSPRTATRATLVTATSSHSTTASTHSVPETNVPTETMSAERTTPAPRRINLHWGDAALAGFENVALRDLPGARAGSSGAAWPWADGSVDVIRAWDVLEHLRDKIGTMNELWRVLRDGGTAEIMVPTTDGSGAFQDPTHVSFWNRRSFLYYEDGNPYRERHATRYGIHARFRVVQERTQLTTDGPQLEITLQATKGAVPDVVVAPSPASMQVHAAEAAPSFVAAMRVKNETAYIHEAISSVLPLCEHVFVFDDHSTDDTPAIVRSFGDRCTIVPSPLVGLDEARDKNALLEHVVRANPAWVLWIDGDEALESNGPAALRAAAASSSRAAGFSLRVAYFWDDRTRVRVDGVYGRFARPSVFRLRGQDAAQLRFAATGNGGNFHCGNVPRGLQGTIVPLPVRLKHFGYVSAEQRERKYRWYTTIDPNNAAEDNYRHLAGIRGARHAPGPAVLVPWRE